MFDSTGYKDLPFSWMNLVTPTFQMARPSVKLDESVENQRGLKEQSVSHLDLGVTHTTMSSAVQNFRPSNKRKHGPVLWPLLCAAAAEVTFLSVR
jgi:hypothetical protein